MWWQMKWSVTGLGGVASSIAVTRVGNGTAIAVGCGDKTIRTLLSVPEPHVGAQRASADGPGMAWQKEFQRLHWQNIPNKVWRESPLCVHKRRCGDEGADVVCEPC